MIAAIVATAKNNVIGLGNELPWYLPDDLKYFSKTTTGHAVIMGRKTADSIIARLGHHLPNRQNIVITHDTAYSPDGFEMSHSIEEALRMAKGDVYVIGGEQIYTAMLPYYDRLYLTKIDGDINGDRHFPVINDNEWRQIANVTHAIDERHPYVFAFTVLERV